MTHDGNHTSPPIGHCRSCGSDLFSHVIDLGHQPSGTSFPLLDDPRTEPTYPVDLWRCDRCGLLQLGDRFSQIEEEISGVRSATHAAHAKSGTEALISELNLQPGMTYAHTRSPHGDGWEVELEAAGLLPARKDQPADLVLDIFGVMHSENFDHDFGETLEKMAPNGYFVIETQDALQLISQGEFATIRVGHPLYFNAHSLISALQRHGFAPISCSTTAAHGGALKLVAAKEGSADASVAARLTAEVAAGVGPGGDLSGIAQRMISTKSKLLDFLHSQQEAGVHVAGYGAPSRGVGLLNWLGVTSDLLPYTADLSPAKQGRRIPGTDIPIVSPAELILRRPDIVLILNYDMAPEVRRGLAELDDHGTRFFLPMPEPREMPDLS